MSEHVIVFCSMTVLLILVIAGSEWAEGRKPNWAVLWLATALGTGVMWLLALGAWALMEWRIL